MLAALYVYENCISEEINVNSIDNNWQLFLSWKYLKSYWVWTDLFLSLHYQCRVKECLEIHRNLNTGQTQCKIFWELQKIILKC